ncbi:MAG: hypothetical protein ACTSWM_09735, partial [Alphaproteobacteria bacterium]
MTLGSWEERGRNKRRRRVYWRLFGVALLVGVIAIAGTWSYDIGTTLARQEVILLERKVSELTEKNETLRDDVLELNTELAGEKIRQEKLETAYKRDTPNEQERSFLTLIRARQDAGVDLERLEFVIGAVSKVRECDLEPTTRRFVANTEIRTGANDTVSFADNSVTVTATGTAALDNLGKPLGWFDPAKPIKVVFTNIDGTRSLTESVLPIQHSVVAGNREYRFNLVAGE